MTFRIHTPARIAPFTAIFALLLPIESAAQEVKYYASGWPIALAEAACGGDEGCLTELANCPPGTDGNCSAQVGTCVETRDSTETLRELCTVRLDEQALVMRLHDGDSAEWSDTTRALRRAIQNPAAEADPTCVTYQSDHLICFTPILDSGTFERWANGQGDTQ